MSARRPGVRLPHALAVIGALLLAWTLAFTLTVPAFAAEDGEEEDEIEVEEEEAEPPDFEEVCAEDEPSAEFCPEAYEEPTWFRWLIRPLLIVGFVIVTALLVAYLVHQPRFAREDEEEGASR